MQLAVHYATIQVPAPRNDPRLKKPLSAWVVQVVEFWLKPAQRGVFIGRKGDGLPGWQTIRVGWAEVLTMVQGIESHRAILMRENHG